MSNKIDSKSLPMCPPSHTWFESSSTDEPVCQCPKNTIYRSKGMFDTNPEHNNKSTCVPNTVPDMLKHSMPNLTKLNTSSKLESMNHNSQIMPHNTPSMHESMNHHSQTMHHNTPSMHESMNNNLQSICESMHHNTPSMHESMNNNLQSMCGSMYYNTPSMTK